MKYSEVVTYINRIPKFTKKNSMDHTKRFMELLENPDKNIKIIHVAGTNGKGSTCAYMNAILCAEGQKVGLFTSPHLEEMTERIRINGMEIAQDRFVAIFQRVMHVVEKMQEEGRFHPTFFEFLLGMAMTAFAEEEVSYAILETGLGGRLDATNVFARPEATVITSIGLDHEQYLGDTIEKIAYEKAGIIKAGVPVIYDGNDSAAAQVIEKRVQEIGCPCKKISNSAYEIIEKTEKYIAFYMKDAYDNSITWKIKNRGSYQLDNAALAITSLYMIRDRVGINYGKWRQALLETMWSGRMEEIADGIFIDGAHNVAAVEALARDIHSVDVLLFSAVSDKNYKAMIQVLTKKIKAKAFIVTTIEDARAVPASELAHLIEREVDTPVYVAESIMEAWETLNQIKTQGGQALCLGSLYLVGMIKKLR